VAYRENFESCPRCATALEDAGDVRACNSCRGQWVLETILAEMVIEMVPPGVVAALTLKPVSHAGDAGFHRGGGEGACPSCGSQMECVSMYGIELERCTKQHGVWCDTDKLQQALNRAADPAVHGAAAAGVPTRKAPPSPQPMEILFGIQTPGDVYREIRTQLQVIKIGRADMCAVQIPNDDRVSRMHAVIEIAQGDVPTIIDLGSRDGTLVNGTRVTKQVLHTGDQLVLGATTVTITFRV